VRELQLRYRVSFRVATATGREWLPVNEVLVVRDLTYDDTQILAKEGEAQMLFRDMQSDAVQQVLRRIQAIRASSGGTAS
jgi:LPS-assembly lipoprotein